jgi:hypothetical protein
MSGMGISGSGTTSEAVLAMFMTLSNMTGGTVTSTLTGPVKRKKFGLLNRSEHGVSFRMSIAIAVASFVGH